jgi:hypothetical protein
MGIAKCCLSRRELLHAVSRASLQQDGKHSDGSKGELPGLAARLAASGGPMSVTSALIPRSIVTWYTSSSSSRPMLGAVLSLPTLRECSYSSMQQRCCGCDPSDKLSCCGQSPRGTGTHITRTFFVFSAFCDPWRRLLSNNIIGPVSIMLLEPKLLITLAT